MSTVLGPDDVAALVAAFPPSATGAQPGLVRSYSGNALVRMHHAHQRFEQLVSQSDERLDCARLPALLDIEEAAAKRILHRSAETLYLSKDGDFIVPERETARVLQELDNEAAQSFVNLSEWSSKVNVLADRLVRLLESSTSSQWIRFTVADQVYICRDDVLHRVRNTIRHVIRDAGSDIVDLTRATTEVPLPTILMDLAREVTASFDGELQLSDSTVVFVPASHASAELENKARLQADAVKRLSIELQERRFCLVTSPVVGSRDNAEDELVQSVIEHYQSSNLGASKSSLTTVEVRDATPTMNRTQARNTSTILLTSEALSEYIDEINRLIQVNAEEVWVDNGKTITTATLVSNVIERYAPSTPEGDAYRLLAQSEYITSFENTAQSQLSQLTAKDHDAFVRIVHDRLLAPLQLYATGVTTIRDSTLKQSLQIFVSDYFHTNFACRVSSEALGKGLLVDKSRKRDVEKYKQACTEAKTLDDFQALAQRLSRKTKIPAPSADKLRDVKKNILKNMLRFQVQNSNLGSVVLQNTIWILLAQRSEGLFVSSGKDTSRMIRQYEVVGDANLAQQLMRWRDLAKADQIGESELLEMRDAAKSVLREMYGADEIR